MKYASKVLATVIATLFLVASNGSAQDSILQPYLGPYRAEVVRVIDGDTIEVDVQVWPGLTARYAIRARGIDAPETRRVGCEKEREWGFEAKEQVERLFTPGTTLRLDDVETDSFEGRVIADIRRLLPSQQYRSLQLELLSRNLAVEWDPTMDDVPWCLLAETRGD